MIDKTQIICTSSFDPYHNQALEEYLFDHVADDTCILYLWQNRQTVVIGQNQNAWQECRVRELEQDGGHLARRLSGGGAVFHDLGNLNFTFAVPRRAYDVARQSEVICRAVASYGLHVERSGRNDITVDGRKFSGNAFFKRGDKAYHHGTLLISSDMLQVSKYLNVPQDKLRSKGVRSVAARVANLSDFCPDITVDSIKERLAQALADVYGAAPQTLTEADCDAQAIAALTQKYASWEWRFGRKIPFEHEIAERFPWGGISIQLSAEGGVITHAAVYSDAMDSVFIHQLSECLAGQPYSSAALRRALSGLVVDAELGYEATPQMLSDIDGLLARQNC